MAEKIHASNSRSAFCSHWVAQRRAMGLFDGISIILQNWRSFLSWIVYPALLLSVCIILSQYLRRQHRRLRYPVACEMSNKSTTRGESALTVASHDSTTGGDATTIHISTPASAPLPSAFDILHPQSQIYQGSAVPSSGQIAALAREQIREDTGAGESSKLFEPHHPRPSHILNRSSNPQSDSISDMSATGSSERVPANGAENLDQCASVILISSDSPSADSVLSTQTNGSETQFQQSVQKRRETVHLMHEIDSEGERAFVRRIVEYR